MTWPPATERLQNWRGGFRLLVRNSQMLRASWPWQGSSLARHSVLRNHREQILQQVQLPCRLKHPTNKRVCPAPKASVHDRKRVICSLTGCL
jgi:hypothetical protein